MYLLFLLLWMLLKLMIEMWRRSCSSPDCGARGSGFFRVPPARMEEERFEIAFEMGDAERKVAARASGGADASG